MDSLILFNAMNYLVSNMNNTHLDIAVNYYYQCFSFDYSTYKDILISFLNEEGIRSVNELHLFEQFLSSIEEKYFKITINGTEVTVNDSNEENQNLIIENTEVEAEINKSDFAFKETARKIYRAIIGVRKVRENFFSDNTDKGDSLAFDTKLNQIFDTDIKYSLAHLALEKCPVHTKESVISKLNEDLFLHLAKSILNAEYLIFDQYNERLKTVEQIFDGKVIQDEIEDRNGRFYSEKAFLRVSWYLIEACSFIRRYLEDKSTTLVLVNSDRKKRFRIKESNNKINYWGNHKTRNYEILLESIIEMTIIDHCFTATPQNVDQLFHLYDQVKQLKNTRNTNKSSLFNEVIDETLAKVSTMLHIILNNDYHKNTEKDIDVDYFYIINSREKEKKDFLDELQAYVIPDLNENSFFVKKKENKGKLNKFEEVGFNLSKSGFKDLHLYHKSVVIGTKAYCDQSVVIDIIHKYNNTDNRVNGDNVIEKIDNFLSTKECNLSPSFFRQVLKILSRIAKEELESAKTNKERLANANRCNGLLKKVLNELLSFTTKYDETNTPSTYRPYFEDSFYELVNNTAPKTKGLAQASEKLNIEFIQTYKLDAFNNKFFFASYGCMPMDDFYLQRLYNKYRLVHKDYVYQYDKMVRDLLQSKVEDASKIREELKRVSQELTNKHLEHTVTSLGVFAAFIAFVTISIDMTKVVRDINEFIFFAMTFTGSLLLFAVYLKHSNTEEVVIEKGEQIIKHKWGPFLLHLGLVVGLCSLLAFAAYNVVKPVHFKNVELVTKQDLLQRKLESFQKDIDKQQKQIDELLKLEGKKPEVTTSLNPLP